MFGIGKSTDSPKRTSSCESRLPLLGTDKKNDDNQYERLFVKIKSGDSSEIEIDIVDSDTVNDLKLKLMNKLNIVGKRIRLIASGRLLDPGNKTLIADFKIQSGAFIHVVISDNQANTSAVANGNPSPENVAGAPVAINYRGLDQLNAGRSVNALTSSLFFHPRRISHVFLCYNLACYMLSNE